MPPRDLAKAAFAVMVWASSKMSAEKHDKLLTGFGIAIRDRVSALPDATIPPKGPSPSSPKSKPSAVRSKRCAATPSRPAQAINGHGPWLRQKKSSGKPDHCRHPRRTTSGFVRRVGLVMLGFLRNLATRVCGRGLRGRSAIAYALASDVDPSLRRSAFSVMTRL